MFVYIYVLVSFFNLLSAAFVLFSIHERFINASLWSEFVNNFSAFSVAVLWFDCGFYFRIFFGFHVFSVVGSARNLTLHRPHTYMVYDEHFYAMNTSAKGAKRKNSFLLNHSTIPFNFILSIATLLTYLFVQKKRNV